jgi:hypothetical protein
MSRKRRHRRDSKMAGAVGPRSRRNAIVVSATATPTRVESEVITVLLEPAVERGNVSSVVEVSGIVDLPQASSVSAPCNGDESSHLVMNIDERFFATTPLEFAVLSDLDDYDEVLASALTPATARRRMKFAKYAKVAVGFALAVCVAAMVRGAIARGHRGGAGRGAFLAVGAAASDADYRSDPITSQDSASHLSAQRGATVAQAGTTRPSGSVTSAARRPDEVGTGNASGMGGVFAGSVENGARAARGEGTAAAGTGKPDRQLAVKEKRASQAALEQGLVAESIEAGQRSVMFDATDGEAWLILGAAYQQQGNGKEARGCYRACLQLGNRGPKRECAAMLR